MHSVLSESREKEKKDDVYAGNRRFERDLYRENVGWGSFSGFRDDALFFQRRSLYI